MSRVGIFGGTFDPIHNGHLQVAEDVRKNLAMEKILFVPSFLPPHKLDKEVTEAGLRFEMVSLALEEYPHFEISEFEFQKEGISYTVETLNALKRSNPDVELFLIMGVDQLLDMDSWREPEKIFQISNVVAMRRPGYRREEIESLDWYSKILWVDVTPIEISSSMIRKKIQQGESVQGLVPEQVEKFIEEKGLYKDS
jgi:nicotinate-nucleotide adenylyltransferase